MKDSVKTLERVEPMGVRQDISDAVTALVAAQRTNLAAAELIMTTVALNTITAQQVTDMNTAIAALRTAMVTANAALRAMP